MRVMGLGIDFEPFAEIKSIQKSNHALIFMIAVEAHGFLF